MNRSAIVLAIITSLSQPCFAQQDPEPLSDRQVFTPEDFASFAPRTARDMVSQIPGFRINEDDQERGFGEASQNVLINGQRISSKSLSARDALERIPAQNVERIELLDGASLDIAGLSGQVVNVVAASSGLTGTYLYRMRFREKLKPFYDSFELSVAGDQGDLAWTATLESDPDRGGNAGRENVFNGQRQIESYREENFSFIGANVDATLGLNWTPDNGHIANLNAQFGIFEGNEREESSAFDLSDALQSTRLFQSAEDEWEAEISGDYEFGVGPGRLKFIGLQRNEHSPVTTRQLGADSDGTVTFFEVYDQTFDENESILRSEYSWASSDTRNWQFSFEGAYNSLDAIDGLLERDAAGNLVRVDREDLDLKVEEARAEAFLTHNWKAHPNLNLEFALGAEVSEIKSSGARAQKRQFTRPKGSATATWTKSDSLTLTGKLSREVGQLDFFDFVSSVDVEDGETQSGNVDIVPAQTWRAELGLERDFQSWGAGTLTLYAEAIDDIIDQVPIFDQGGNILGAGPGNLETAQRFGFDLEGTLTLDPIGWTGAQINYTVDYRISDVEDPVTDASRRINADKISYYELELRHDIENTDWAWGLYFEQYYEAPVFRLSTVRQFESKPGFSYGFIEHKDVFGLTATAFVGNLIDMDNQFTRQVFEPDRNGELVRIEDRTRNFGPILTLRLKGTF